MERRQLLGGAMNTFPVQNDRETRELVAGHIARATLHHEWRIPREDPQVYVLRDDAYRIGWSVTMATSKQQLVTCAFCHATVAMQIHAMFEHSVLLCGETPTNPEPSVA